MREKRQQYPLFIDLDIWSKFKSKASLDRYNLRDALEHFIKLYLDGKIKLPKK